MKVISLASSKGIGKSISNELNNICEEVITTSSSDLDTSDLEQVKKFVKHHKSTDVLILNTGGPPAKNFFEITEDEWLKYYYQLFYSFVYIIQNLHINDNGYVFLISSHQIKEPKDTMSLSVSYRIAFSSILKLLTKQFGNRQVSCINIAPGPIGTDRLKDLVDDLDKLESKLPMKRVGEPKEIGLFVKSIIENKIKYLTGVTINFDGGYSSYIL